MDSEGPCLDMEVGYDNKKASFDMTKTMIENKKENKLFILGRKMIEGMNLGFKDILWVLEWSEALYYISKNDFIY